jgi:RHS repeat-associated protein
MSDNLGTAQSAQTTYTYDADGNQATVEDDNGNTVNYAYNVSGQVSCVGYPGSTKIVTNCSGAASATNPIVINAYSPTNNLLSSTTDWLGHTTSYGYSPDGLNNLTSIDYPTTSADSVTYGYNADSLVNTQAYSGSSLSSVPNQTWGYNPDSLVSSATQLDAPGGTISSYSSSPSYSTPNTTLDRNWIQENTNPGVSGADTYAYNANGELASDTSPSSSSTSYGYNADVELCWSASGSSANACLSPPTGAGTTTYTSTPDGQRCWSAGSSISNAQCSTPPSSGATGYAWNAYGQLCWTGPITATPSCASPPSGVTLFTYDGSGNRTTEKSASGVTQDFTWDDAGSTPTLLQDGSNAYVYGPTLFGESVPVEQVNLSTGVASYLTSARSGVQLVLNQSGTVANESSYKTYGSQVNSSTSATPFGFQGGYTDASGLIFLVHRYYDPSTGQFISVDPKVSTTVQPYAYCGDDPLNLTDPTGQDAAGVAFLNSVSHASPQTQLLFACASHFGFDACVKYYANQNAVNAYMCAQAGSCKATFNVPNGCGFQSVAGGLECLGGAIANAADPSHIADCVTGFGGDWMTGFWIIGGTVWYVSQFIPVWDISLDAATFLGGSVAIAAGCGVGVHAGDTTVDH